MEMFEIRYFQAVADLESINRAAQKLHVSTSALSKAINRLEEELHVELFVKEGRNIRLTEKGRLLHKKSKSMLEIENDIKVSLSSDKASPEIVIGGPEVFLAHYGVPLIVEWLKKFPSAKFTFLDIDNGQIIEALKTKKVDICLTTDNRLKDSSLGYKQIDKTLYATYVGSKHPLYRRQGGIPIKDVLQYDFVSASKETDLIDDWRDDKFPRNLKYKNVGLKTLENLIESGLAVGYLPSFFGDTLKGKKLEITGCPYSCDQKVFLAFNKSGIDWLLN
jgi:LysR family transcriptional activator of glutamate synthase operon